MRQILTSLFVALTILTTLAAPIDDAKQLYYEGKYEEALARLQPMQKRSPRNGEINYWLGATLVALNRNDEAEKYLSEAENRGVAKAALMLAQLAFNQYRPTDALEYYDSYETLLRKNNRKAVIPEEVEQARRRLVLMENMLSRVEQIAVIDSIVVDADAFFTAYRLSPEAGSLVGGAMVHLPDVEMAFVPQNNTEILYSEPDSAGTFVLMGADILDDGTFDHAAPLQGDNLGGGGNAEYPFLLSDGMTLYFANDGEGSIGGYDIFLTRRNDDGFLQPQNIGMPYNSPDDDYLLAIDETTGLGWWATDRNHIPGKVTIYVFVSSTTRVNVSTDSPDLAEIARLSDISLTHTPGVDYSEYLARIDAIGNASNVAAGNQKNSFYLAIGSTDRIYHNLSDFRSSQARSAMAQAIDARAKINRLTGRLAELRQEYGQGDRSVAITILNLEQQLDEARRTYRQMTDKAINLELNN